MTVGDGTLVTLLCNLPKEADFFAYILAIRGAGWKGVTGKLHKVEKIFPFGPDSREFLLYGSVKYLYDDARSGFSEWAGRVCLVEVEEELKIDFYQVYMVSNDRQMILIIPDAESQQDTAA